VPHGQVVTRWALGYETRRMCHDQALAIVGKEQEVEVSGLHWPDLLGMGQERIGRLCRRASHRQRREPVVWKVLDLTRLGTVSCHGQ